MRQLTSMYPYMPWTRSKPPRLWAEIWIRRGRPVWLVGRSFGRSRSALHPFDNRWEFFSPITSHHRRCGFLLHSRPEIRTADAPACLHACMPAPSTVCKASPLRSAASAETRFDPSVFLCICTPLCVKSFCIGVMVKTSTTELANAQSLWSGGKRCCGD